MTQTNPMQTGLDWLAAIELDPAMSDDSKVVAAILSDHWAGAGEPTDVWESKLITQAALPTTARHWEAIKRLRHNGYLTGKGKSKHRYRLHDPAVQRSRLHEQVAEENLNRRIRATLGGS